MFSCNYNFLKYQNNRWEVDIKKLQNAKWIDLNFDYEHLKKDIERFKNFIAINENNPNAQNYWLNYLTIVSEYKIIIDTTINQVADQVPRIFLLRKLPTLKNIRLL